MKKTVTFILLLFIAYSYGQELKLSGKWKLINYEDDRVRFDLYNDSIFRKKNTAEVYDPMEEIVKKGFRETSIEFTEKKKVIMKSGVIGSFEFPYEIDLEKKIIVVERKKDDLWEWSYNYYSENKTLMLVIQPGIKIEMKR